MIAEPISVPVTPEVVTPIKPSEAIRLGCLLAPVQAFGSMGFGNEACAMGAMYLGWGIDGTAPQEAANTACDAMVRLGTLPCPVGCRSNRWLVLAHLNDTHQWTREAIADWLATEHNL